ncbi:MAG: LuxR C-terminal-related transcriptional regulator, partial [Actinomycetota bacterium]
MKASWPLVGRETELDAIASAMSSGAGGVVIAGPAGVGKTRLAAESLALAASQGLTTVQVAATSGAGSLPFGAFVHLLPDIQDPTNPTGVLRQIAQAVRERGNGRSVAIMIDDAHLLDDSSAALTYRLIEGADTFVIATLRAGEPAPEAILSSWKDGLAERLDLHPLSGPQIDELLHRALGGPIDGATLEIFKERARGNALFLRELVLGALDLATLAEREGVWRLTGGLQVPDRLVEIIETRFAALKASDRRAVQTLACGEPLGAEMFLALAPGVSLERLEGSGLLGVEQAERRTTLRLHHPLQAEVLRSKLPPVAHRHTARRIAQAIESTGARRKTDVLLVAIQRLEGGVPSNPQVMLQAARMARLGNDLQLAERLARAAGRAEVGFDAGLLLGQLCWHQGRATEAAQLLRELAPTAETDQQRAVLASAHADVLHLGLGDSQAALEVAQKAEASINDDALRDELVAARARILGRMGNTAQAAALVEPLLDRATGVALLNACFAAGTSAPVTGRFSQALKATELGYKAHSDDTSGAKVGFSPYVHQAFRCYALAQAGYMTRAWEFGSAQYAQAVHARSLDGQGFLCVSLASTLLAQGRPATGERFAGEAVGVFRQLGWGFMERLGLIELVMARAQRGKVDEALATLRELDRLGIAETDLWGPRLLQARAWVEVAGNNLAWACNLLWRSVEMARSGGAYATACAALYDLARLGKAVDAAKALQQEIIGVEGLLAPLQVASAGALVARDPVRLEQVSASWEGIGALLLAAESSMEAAVAWRRRGDKRRATRAELRSADLQSACEGATTPILATDLPASVALTPRELEVARMAAAGLTDKQVAEQLFLSPRTVGNALYSAYQKLGVRGRDELAALL